MNDYISNIPRIYTAIAEWAACTAYILVLPKRFNGWRLWLLSAAALGFFCGFQYLAGLAPLWLWIPDMALAMAVMYFMILGFCRLKWGEAVFWMARAFVLAEFAASLEWQFYYYCARFIPDASEILPQAAFLAAIYLAVYAAAYFLERRYVPANNRLSITRHNVSSAAALALTAFVISNMSFITENSPISGSSPVDIFWIRTLVDLCGLILLFVQQEQRLGLFAKNELSSIRNVLMRQYEQYTASKDNIDFLNRRYHDLKNQISVIRAEGDPQKKGAYLDELERGIKVYEAQTQTGNGVLDVVLTGKARLCVEKGINFSCVADGALLGFMDVMDICSVFGNALDNAVESAGKQPDPDKRLIKMALYRRSGFMIARFENYSEDKPIFENGLPVTTKPDKRNHGYGIKSIKSTAERYGGNVSVRTEDNWFVLCVLIPLGAGPLR
ncbi:MAG: ATP-binding protein [Clostridiales bacterium]|jgi:hypothetical protein|nr:ATP-binding protein [Clostridiales bacterium]